ncbi:GntR family transcriptional regulator [Stenotrophomonas sp. HMSC10F06]|uniref:aminotransferase-like domain-containing protein n=1 Tax=Stenotrophomonas sp. HMSC10F06 TaxID=1581081 RepID=UPI0008A24A66|nr:PLP-dependent aminotransferase family protein [Stenotrophomonas sp. HMSC10F06]OFS90772.1 GntR family transcriptional regulator [Stenotrophomonas sp. HMSC10F06]
MEWSPLIADGHGPVYLRIVQALERAVWSGALCPGERLPAQRALANELGVDLTTITRAFTEGRKRGLIDARGPLGSFVAPPQVELTQLIDLSMNLPPSPGGQQVAEVLRRGLSSVLTRSDVGNLMTYHVGGGSRADHQAAQQWLKPILGKVDADTLVVTEGAQAALSALLLALTDAGDTILCEPLVYPGLLHAARVLDRRLHVVECDAHGMRPDALARIAKERDARVVYLNPTAQNPTAHTMPQARREALAEVIRAQHLLLIEDDPYWLLLEDAPAPLALLAPQQACYISTLSKCLSPGLHTGFVRLPDGMDRQPVLDALRAVNLMAPPLMNALVTQLILDGSAQAMLKLVQDEAAERRYLARSALSPRFLQHCAGVHAWCRLPAHWTDASLTHAARLQGLGIAPSSAFTPDGVAINDAVRISLGAAANRQELHRALRQLDQLMHVAAAESPGWTV